MRCRGASRGAVWLSRTAGGLLLAIALACGGSDPTDVQMENPIDPFVGTWDAEVFDVTSDADTTIVADLVENGSFVINVQPSGTYTATLEFGGIPLVEIGQLSVSEGFVTLQPTNGDVATSSYTFLSDDYLRLEGPTDFDFNLDGELDPAEALIELRRR